MITDIIRITRDINSFLADIEEKYPEAIWEEIMDLNRTAPYPRYTQFCTEYSLKIYNDRYK